MSSSAFDVFRKDLIRILGIRSSDSIASDVDNFDFIGFVKVEDAELDVGFVDVKQSQLFAGSNFDVVDLVLDPALVVVDGSLNFGACVDGLVDFGVHLVILALVCIQAQDLGVDVVQGGVYVVSIVESEHQPGLVALHGYNLELELPHSFSHEGVVGLEGVPVVGPGGFDEYSVLQQAGALDGPVGEVDHLGDAAAQLDGVDEILEVLVEALEVLADAALHVIFESFDHGFLLLQLLVDLLVLGLDVLLDGLTQQQDGVDVLVALHQVQCLFQEFLRIIIFSEFLLKFCFRY